MRPALPGMMPGLLLMAGVLLATPPLARVGCAAAGPVEIVCITCHGGQAGHLGAPVALWRQSVHAGNGVACNDCHGGDPNGKNAEEAMDPARGFRGVPKEIEIPAVCGNCHVGVMNDYLASEHGKALGSGGPTCVTCHGNHKVVRASLDLINEKDCSRCHSYDRAKLIRDAMVRTEGLIVSAGEAVTAFKDEGADVERLEKGLFSLRNRFHTLFHDQDVEKVRRESARIDAELAKIDSVLKGISETRRHRKVVGGVAVAGALLAALLFHLLKKTYD